MNGYFRVVPGEGTIDLEVYAPTAGGAPVTTSDVSGYLTSKAINFDLAAVTKAVEQGYKANIKVVICRGQITPLSESIAVSVSKDKMEAYIVMFAPSPEGSRLSADDIKKTLHYNNVTHGINEEEINRLVTTPEYCTTITIAKGALPTASEDAEIEYLFNTDKKTKPAQNEDGSVDFFNLNVLQICSAGQVLARLHPAKVGDAGYMVDGTVIKPRDPKTCSFKYGNNVEVSADGKELIAKVNGDVSLVGGQVFVNNNLTFEQIGPSTGNIDFDGSVTVEGNVDTNFEVKAQGDVVVNGVVEGAMIEAGGNIIIAKGVNGMGKAVLKAGGNIIAKYMENVTATADGYISAEAIMHSTISASGDILVDGRKGMLSGGKATAGGCIEVKTLGAQMANDTVVEVGLSPMIKREIQTLRQEIAEKQKVLAQIQPVLQNLAIKIKSGTPLSAEQKVYVSKLMATQNATNAELEPMINRLNELEQNYDADTESCVKVKGVAYPGTRVCISDVSMAVKTPTKYCKFVKLRGDVKITSYE